MIKKNTDKIVLVILSILCVTLFSTVTSPLYPMNYNEINNSVSASQLLIGKGISMGYIPYKDLFGYSGPLLYFIESIGYFIGINETFVYIIQLVLLSLSLICLNQIIKIYTTRAKSLLYTVIVLFPIAAAQSGGGSADEFCLLPIIAVLYIALKAVRKKGERITGKLFFLLGICFALIFFVRWVQGICVLGIALYLLIYRKGNRIRNLILFFLPVLIMALVISGYFIHYDAFAEMVYGTFIFPCKALLAGSSTANEIIRKGIKVIPALALAVTSLFYEGNEKKLLVLFSLLSVCTLMLERGYWYYYIVLSFHIPLALSLLDHMKKKIFFHAVEFAALVLVFIVPFKTAVLNMISTAYKADNEIKTAWYEENAQDSKKMLVIDGGSSFYLINDCMPSQRFFSSQTNLALIDMNISDELIEYTENSEDQWMLVGSNGWVYEEYGNYTLINMITDGNGKFLYIYEIFEEEEESEN